jgi:hypothetical protein
MNLDDLPVKADGHRVIFLTGIAVQQRARLLESMQRAVDGMTARATPADELMSATFLDLYRTAITSAGNLGNETLTDAIANGLSDALTAWNRIDPLVQYVWLWAGLSHPPGEERGSGWVRWSPPHGLAARIDEDELTHEQVIDRIEALDRAMHQVRAAGALGGEGFGDEPGDWVEQINIDICYGRFEINDQGGAEAWPKDDPRRR